MFDIAALCLVVTALLASGAAPGAAQAGTLLLHEAGGGIAFGLVLGHVTYRLLKSIESYQVEVLLTLAAVATVVTLLARVRTVGLPVRALQRFFKLPAGAWKLLTWGGLRGGISVALALSIPVGPERSTVLSLTCCVVVFSILVQGLTVGRLARATVVGGCPPGWQGRHA